MVTRRAADQKPLRQGVTEAIVAAMFAELAESGYARLSMDAVARRAGVGKAALYRRWPSKESMLSDLLEDAVRATLPPSPDTGALRSDLREFLGHLRDQLSGPTVARVGLGVVAEAAHRPALEAVLRQGVTVPRRAAAAAILRAAIDRGELPGEIDLELALDLMAAPLAFRILFTRGDSGDAYLDTLTNAIEAALRAAVATR